MRTHIIEATNGELNWGKFMVGVMDTQDWRRMPMTPGCDQGMPLLQARRWDVTDIWVMDLETREGAVFRLANGDPSGALNKHQIWVCPLFEPFVNWLFTQPHEQILMLALPDWVDLPDAVFAFKGHRRPGPMVTMAAIDSGPVVHILYHGVTHCGMVAPSSWPTGHQWVARDDGHKATCKGCIEAQPRA